MENHLRAMVSLQDSIVRDDVNDWVALESEVQRARAARITATDEYRRHLQGHETLSAGSST